MSPYCPSTNAYLQAGFLVLRQVACNLAFWTLLTGTLRLPVSVSAEICVPDDICAHVDVCLCASWHQILHPLGVLGGTHCKQIFVGISKSLEHVFYTILSFSLSHTHARMHGRRQAGRHIHLYPYIHTYFLCLLTRSFSLSLSLCLSAHTLSRSISLYPFP